MEAKDHRAGSPGPCPASAPSAFTGTVVCFLLQLCGLQGPWGFTCGSRDGVEPCWTNSSSVLSSKGWAARVTSRRESSLHIDDPMPPSSQEVQGPSTRRGARGTSAGPTSALAELEGNPCHNVP